MEAACNWTGAREVVIVGGGAAGIGLASSLLKRQAHFKITVIEPASKHYYQPAWTLVGTGQFDVTKTERNMVDCIPKGVEWIQAKAMGFNPEKNQVLTEC